MNLFTKGNLKKVSLGIALGLAVFSFSETGADQASSKATQLIRVSYGIKDNREMIRILNSTITNRGTEKEKLYYRRCILHHMESEILYQEMDLGLSYAELRRTQNLLVNLYQMVVEEEIEELQSEFVALAGKASGKEKPETREYFRLGYRELVVARQKLLTAKNSRPFLPALKLHDLSFALHSLKDAEKYIVLLGLLHDSNQDMDRDAKSFERLFAEIDRIIVGDKKKYQRFLFDSRFENFEESDFYANTWATADVSELETPILEFDPSYKRKPSMPAVPK